MGRRDRVLEAAVRLSTLRLPHRRQHQPHRVALQHQESATPRTFTTPLAGSPPSSRGTTRARSRAWSSGSNDGGRPVETVLVAADGTRQQAETFTYNSDGHKTRVQYRAFAGLPEDVEHEAPDWQRFIPSSSEGSPSPIVTVLYDASNRPSEVLIHTSITSSSFVSCSRATRRDAS